MPEIHVHNSKKHEEWSKERRTRQRVEYAGEGVDAFCLRHWGKPARHITKSLFSNHKQNDQ
jgi:hypothetical protein